MHDDKVKEMLNKAYTNAAPDVLSSVLKDCREEKGKVIIMENNRTSRRFRPLTAIAACLLLIFTGTFAAVFYNANYAVSSTVSLDVNPSIELTVNSKERVLSVTPLNEDGVIVAGDMDFAGSDIDVAVNALIGSMLRNGYLSELANSILISVADKDEAQAAALQHRLSNQVNALLQAESFSGAVLSQTVSSDTQLQQTAAQYSISEGKAKLISKIIAANPRHTFDELVPLSINELNLLLTPVKETVEVSSSGNASEAAYIGKDKAKQIALAAAGASESSIKGYEVELDVDDGRMEYEIEFVFDGVEYEYDIDALTGDILQQDTEGRRDASIQQPASAPSNQPTVSTDTPRNDAANDAAADSSAGADYVGNAAAKSAALSHAGLSPDSVKGFECELDRENGKVVYDISFISGKYEYDYDIDAFTGKVLKQEKELND